MKKEIVVLGASGSIGKQALELLRYNNDYKLVGICLNSNTEKIEEELLYFDTLKTIAISDNKKAEEFEMSHLGYKVLKGDDSIIELVNMFPKATILNALMGNIGLYPTLEAIKNNQTLLLSNKESLVIGSSLVKEALKKSKSKIYPIDSEHVALAKLLNHLKDEHISKKDIKRMIITASGGALRKYPLDKLNDVKKEDVLHHPTWKMSNKITIDSATLVNKAYEVIEASVLFYFPISRIEPIICEESLIHAEVIYERNGKEERIVEFSPCDMKVAINYALSLGKTKTHNIWDGDTRRLASLHIYEVNHNRYPLFDFALSIYKRFSNIGMLFFNDLDSKLIDCYLNDEIKYQDIEKGLKMLPDYLNNIDLKLRIENLKNIEEEAKFTSYRIINKLKEGK